jgi:hypothetical protein
MRALLPAAFALLAAVLAAPSATAEGPPTCTTWVVDDDVGAGCFDHNSHEACPVFWRGVWSGGCREAGYGTVDRIIDQVTALVED